MKTFTLRRNRLLAAFLCVQMATCGTFVIAADKKAPPSSAAEMKKREEELRKKQEKMFIEQRKNQEKMLAEQRKKAMAAQKKAYEAEQKRLAEAKKKQQEEEAKRAAAEKKKREETAKAAEAKKKQEAAKANTAPKSTPSTVAKPTPTKPAPAKPVPVVSRPVTPPVPAGVVASVEPKWSTLFDGKSTAFFRSSASDAFPEGSWKVADGALRSVAGTEKTDLLSRLEYENFEMEFEWKVKPGSKSGLVYRTKEATGTDHIGPAMALVEGSKEAKFSAGALAGLLTPSPAELKSEGEFNQGKLVVLGDHVEHWINGQKVLEYDWSDPELKKMVGESSLAKTADFMSLKKGYIAFQHNGDEAAFRNVRLRRLLLK